MKILFIAPLPPPVTGQSVATHALYDQLKLDGHDVFIINLSKNTFRQGVSSLSRIVKILLLTWRTWRAGRGFDAVYLTTSESLAGNLKDNLLLLVLGKLRAKTWLHLHGGAGMRKLLANNSLVGFLNGFFLSRIAGVIVLGERLAPIFDQYVPPARIRIVKNFAPDNLFLSAEEFSEKWSNVSVLRVLFLSNLLPGKGYEELLQAIQSLSPVVASRFRFDFAGGFETEADRARFKLAISSLQGVNYHGVVHGETKQALFAKAHIFCLPTFYPYEGQPISILEAYASGCVVLTTDHSGIFDIFTPGKNGLEVRPCDPVSIKIALEALATATADAEEFAYHNCKEASQLYTRQTHLSSLYAAMGWSR